MKRFLHLSIIVLIVLTIFTGCRAKQESTIPDAEPPKADVPGAQVSPTPAEPSKIGTKDSPVEVTIIIKDVLPTEEHVIKLLSEIESGMAAEGNYVKLELLEPPAGAYGEVLPIALRTGQISPDIIYFQGGEVPIAQEGLLADLTTFIENSTNVKAIMQEHNIEAIKNFPYLLWLAPPRVRVPVMRSDWFNSLESSKALLDNPTPENYYAMFNEMIEKGLSQYAITTDGSIARLDSVFNHAFGITSSIMKVDGRYVYSRATQNEKEKLAFYAKLFRGGLLDSEFVTNKWDTMEQAFYEGRAGLVVGTAGDVVGIYNNRMIQAHGDAAELVVLPPAKGISQAYLSVDVTKEPRGFAINADSKVKDAAWAVLEFMAGAEGRRLDKLGLEGIHYNISDGKITLTEMFPEWWARFWPTMNGLDTSEVIGDVLSAPAVSSLGMATDYYHSDVNVILPTDLIPLMDAMNTLYIDYSIGIIQGVKSIDSFDEFINKWNAAGGDKISEFLATQLN